MLFCLGMVICLVCTRCMLCVLFAQEKPINIQFFVQVILDLGGLLTEKLEDSTFLSLSMAYSRDVMKSDVAWIL